MNLIMYNIKLEPKIDEIYKEENRVQNLLIDLYSFDMFLLDRFIPVDGRYSHLAPPNRLLTWEQVKEYGHSIGACYWCDNFSMSTYLRGRAYINDKG